MGHCSITRKIILENRKWESSLSPECVVCVALQEVVNRHCVVTQGSYNPKCIVYSLLAFFRHKSIERGSFMTQIAKFCSLCSLLTLEEKFFFQFTMSSTVPQSEQVYSVSHIQKPPCCFSTPNPNACINLVNPGGKHLAAATAVPHSKLSRKSYTDLKVTWMPQPLSSHPHFLPQLQEVRERKQQRRTEDVRLSKEALSHRCNAGK